MDWAMKERLEERDRLRKLRLCIDAGNECGCITRTSALKC
jgi:hypothetical protein